MIGSKLISSVPDFEAICHRLLRLHIETFDSERPVHFSQECCVEHDHHHCFQSNSHRIPLYVDQNQRELQYDQWMKYAHSSEFSESALGIVLDREGDVLVASGTCLTLRTAEEAFDIHVTLERLLRLESYRQSIHAARNLWIS